MTFENGNPIKITEWDNDPMDTLEMGGSPTFRQYIRQTG